MSLSIMVLRLNWNLRLAVGESSFRNLRLRLMSFPFGVWRMYERGSSVRDLTVAGY